MQPDFVLTKSESLEVTELLHLDPWVQLAGSLKPVQRETPVLVEVERPRVRRRRVHKVGVEADVELLRVDNSVGAHAEAVEGRAAEAVWKKKKKGLLAF